MKSTALLRVLRTLWRMLLLPQRLMLSLLMSLLLVAGILEMAGVMLILGYIQGLSINPAGERGGKLFKGLQALGYNLEISQADYVIFFGMFVLGVLLFKNLFASLAEYALNRFLTKLNQRVSVGLFRGYLVTPYERLQSSGGARDIHGIFQVFAACFQAVVQVVADGLTLVMVIGLLAFLDPWMAFMAFALFGFAGGGLYRLLAKKVKRMTKLEKRAQRVGRLYLTDGLTGAVETRLRDARATMIKGYRSSLARAATIQRRIYAMRKLPKAVNEFTLGLLVVGAVWRIAILGGSVENALPTLGVFAFAGLKLTGFASRVNRAMQRLRSKANTFERYARAIREVAPTLFAGEEGEQAEDYLSDEKKLPRGNDGRLHDRIVLENLTYTYPGSDVPALVGVNLEIERGTSVGICGPSGGGKSTLARLILGLMRPTSGEIRCDEWSVFHHIRSWHRNIGYVGQEVYLSRRTIRENIAFGVPSEEIDDERVWQVLAMASADGFVGAMKKGIRARLRHAGKRLSGGQKQRLAIARALYHDPDVIVFDEATASLDNKTEREITDAIQALSQRKTVICIAHRLNTIRHCDNILVLEAGEIREEGTYEELLAESRLFRELVQAGEP